ncbi:MAG TPA: hypothetical protein VFS60_11675, partial [Thermoanaerobaculia bacterium]|nr:hypothetical protein [Thermoanaerobaculia bacterium]
MSALATTCDFGADSVFVVAGAFAADSVFAGGSLFAALLLLLSVAAIALFVSAGAADFASLLGAGAFATGAGFDSGFASVGSFF